MVDEGLKQTFSAVTKMLVHKMTHIEKEEVEFSVCHLVVRKVQYKVAAPFLILIHYIYCSAV